MGDWLVAELERMTREFQNPRCSPAAAASDRPAPVSPPLTDKAKAWAQHQAAVVALESFQIEGRVAIKRGTEGGSVKLRWQQRAFATDLSLMAPPMFHPHAKRSKTLQRFRSLNS